MSYPVFPGAGGTSGTEAQVDTVQTIDATPTVLATYAIPVGEEKILTVKAQGHKDLGGDHIAKKMEIFVKNVGGVASLVGVDSALGYDAGASAWTIVASVSSGNVVITVTGDGGTIGWRATMESD